MRSICSKLSHSRVTSSVLHNWCNRLLRVTYSHGSARGNAVDDDLIVLGIESSCDDTGVGVVSTRGQVLGEALHSQLSVHLKTGGVVPYVAGDLHAKHIGDVTQEALRKAHCTIEDVSAIGVTIGPGLAPCLRAGVEFAKNLALETSKPLVCVHHMEAHALTARLSTHVPFPFLVLLVSGGHCLLLVAEGVGSFKRLGYSTDDSPGEALDKVARMLMLHTHPELNELPGGAAVEVMAARGDRSRFTLPHIMATRQDCMFSFSGLKTAVKRMIDKLQDNDCSDAPFKHNEDMSAAVQHAVCRHLLTRTHRAILYSTHRWPSISHLVVSGGVASNKYLRDQMNELCLHYSLNLVCPPPQLCTDNGIMIAWAAVEQLRTGAYVRQPQDLSGVDFKPRWPLGDDISRDVAAAKIKLSQLL